MATHIYCYFCIQRNDAWVVECLNNSFFRLFCSVFLAFSLFPSFSISFHIFRTLSYYFFFISLPRSFSHFLSLFFAHFFCPLKNKGRSSYFPFWMNISNSIFLNVFFLESTSRTNRSNCNLLVYQRAKYIYLCIITWNCNTFGAIKVSKCWFVSTIFRWERQQTNESSSKFVCFAEFAWKSNVTCYCIECEHSVVWVKGKKPSHLWVMVVMVQRQ